MCTGSDEGPRPRAVPAGLLDRLPLSARRLSPPQSASALRTVNPRPAPLFRSTARSSCGACPRKAPARINGRAPHRHRGQGLGLTFRLHPLAVPNLDVASAERLINGKLTYEIGVGGRELDAINAAFRVSGQKIVIVRDMVSVYYLGANAGQHATSLTLKSDYAGDVVPIGTGANREDITITAVNGTTLTINPGLQHAHTTHHAVEFPAAGWSGNPIIPLELLDVTSNTSMMYCKQGGADHRLRYKPLPVYYTALYSFPDQNQWQTISRD